jgi:hypothetical protein
MAFLAFRQWLWARKLDVQMVKAVNDLLPLNSISKSKQGIMSRPRNPADVERAAKHDAAADGLAMTNDTGNRKRTPWTRVHSHFALMGGFAFDANGSLPEFFPDSRTRLTLTPQALRRLAKLEPMLIPDISDRAIKDKSKANWLAKALVCLQACWFIVQVVGRTVNSVPISLLEMNTLLHALCCLIIYLAWWHKPLDIVEPELIKIDTENARKICAWMIMCSRLGAVKVIEPSSGPKRGGYLVHDEELYPRSELSKCKPDDPRLQQLPKCCLEDDTRHQLPREDAHSTTLKLYAGHKVHGFRLVPRNYEDYKGGVALTVDSAALECLRLANLVRTDPGMKDDWHSGLTVRQPARVGMVVSHISNFEDLQDDALDGFKGSTALTRQLDAETFFWVLLLFAGSIYGLIHLLAWNGPFATLGQRWTWRVACFVIASPSVVVSILVPGYKLYRCLEDKSWARIVFAPLWYPCDVIHKMFPSESSQELVVVGGLASILALVYLAARVYLLVECFINIAQLPPEVYQVPQWSQYIPHLGAG